jgi:CRP-like cAMP-binding protein
MYEQLLQQLNQFILINPQQQKDLCRVLQTEERAKGDILLEQGQVANYLYFIVEGIIRSYCQVNGKEVTCWFGLQGNFCTSYFSFVHRQPSEDNIVVVTDCKLLTISHGRLQDLFQQDTVWVDLNRRLLEYYYTALLERVISFQTQSTTERYNSFLEEYPGLEDKITLGHLASYLGMTQETLSRLRARKRRRQQG